MGQTRKNTFSLLRLSQKSWVPWVTVFAFTLSHALPWSLHAAEPDSLEELLKQHSKKMEQQTAADSSTGTTNPQPEDISRWEVPLVDGVKYVWEDPQVRNTFTVMLVFETVFVASILRATSKSKARFQEQINLGKEAAEEFRPFLKEYAAAEREVFKAFRDLKEGAREEAVKKAESVLDPKTLARLKRRAKPVTPVVAEPTLSVPQAEPEPVGFSKTSKVPPAPISPFDGPLDKFSQAYSRMQKASELIAERLRGAGNPHAKAMPELRGLEATAAGEARAISGLKAAVSEYRTFRNNTINHTVVSAVAGLRKLRWTWKAKKIKGVRIPANRLPLRTPFILLWAAALPAVVTGLNWYYSSKEKNIRESEDAAAAALAKAEGISKLDETQLEQLPEKLLVSMEKAWERVQDHDGSILINYEMPLEYRDADPSVRNANLEEIGTYFVQAQSASEKTLLPSEDLFKILFTQMIKGHSPALAQLEDSAREELIADLANEAFHISEKELRLVVEEDLEPGSKAKEDDDKSEKTEEEKTEEEKNPTGGGRKIEEEKQPAPKSKQKSEQARVISTPPPEALLEGSPPEPKDESQVKPKTAVGKRVLEEGAPPEPPDSAP